MENVMIRETAKLPPSEKMDDKTIQITRSLGYLISQAGSSTKLYTSLLKAHPELNKKLMKRLAATLHVINKVKDDKTPKDTGGTDSND